MMLLLAIAGGLGAVTRFLVDALVARHSPFRVPLGTLVVNVSGSLLLGILTGLVTGSDPASAAVTAKAVVGTGFCGGYTTFSTASVESVRLWLAEGATTGIRYAAVTLLGSVAAASAGLALGSFMSV